MSGLHGRPTTGELVAAVREFVEGLSAAGTGPDPFETRVAAELLRIVERELASDSPPPAGIRMGLGDDVALAAAVRAGTLSPAQYAALASELAADVEARIAVAAPGYTDGYEPDSFGS